MNNIESGSISSKELLDAIGNKLIGNENVKLYDSVKAQIKSYYDEYDKNTNNLEAVKRHYEDTNGEIPNFLKNLYSRDRADIASLWNSVIKANGNRIIRCPLCGIGNLRHFDHYMPRSIFPEFSVHSNNLIPLCAECNENKSQVWLNDKHERIIFNAYYDVPKDNVLTCTISISDNNLPVVEINYSQPEKSWTIHEKTIRQLGIIPRLTNELAFMLGDEIEVIKSRYDSHSKKEEYVENYMETCLDLTRNRSLSENKRLLYEGMTSSPSFRQWIMTQISTDEE